MSIVMEATSST